MRTVFAIVCVASMVFLVALAYTGIHSSVAFHEAKANYYVAKRNNDLEAMRLAYKEECQAHAMLLFVTRSQLDKLGCLEGE
jgi:hypothetical protein